MQAFRHNVATLLELASRTRLDTAKLVTEREAEIKTEQVTRGKAALTSRLNELNLRIGKPYMSLFADTATRKVAGDHRNADGRLHGATGGDDQLHVPVALRVALGVVWRVDRLQLLAKQ